MAAAALSGGLLFLAFPGYGAHHLAWFALIPLFLRAEGSRSGARAFLLYFVAGAVFSAGLLFWTLEVRAITPLKFVLFQLFMGLQYGLLGAASWKIVRKWPGWNPILYPANWALFEYLRTHVGWVSFPFGLLGYSQYDVPSVVRLSAYTGVYGVSFLIVAVNAALASIFSVSLTGWRKDTPVSRGVRTQSLPTTPFAVIAAVALLIGILFSSGRASSDGQDTAAGTTVRAALIQGNVAYGEGDYYDRDFEYLEKGYRAYEKLSLQSAAERPAIIVWPSSAIPGRIPYDFKLVRMIGELSRKTGAHLLVGTAGFDKFKPEMQKTRRSANSAFLFSPEGEILGGYDKINLLPFDEYLPLRGRLPWPSWIISEGMVDELPGNKLTVFEANGVRFGVQICWENMFPDQFREMASKGIDFMCCMTNETFAESAGAKQQMLMFYVLRAVENRIAIVRTAPTGLSCIISPDGRITERLRGEGGKEFNIAGTLVGEVPLSSGRTFYTRHGDVFLVVLVAFLAVFAMVPSRRFGKGRDALGFRILRGEITERGIG